jgi:hypothetical protein
MKNTDIVENKVVLRPYQQEIAEKSVLLLNGPNRFVYLSMEVRCGKTFTALKALDLIGSISTVLFVTKKKAIGGIQKDYKALAPSYSCDFINYESLHKVVETCYDAIVFDEAHGMGAFPKPSLRAIEARRLIQHCDPYVIFLSGTPSPESYSQMYHQMWILGYRSPFTEPTFYKWAHSYVKIWERMINGFRVHDYSNGVQEKIMEAVKPYMISYTQNEAGFTSKVNEHVLKVTMSDTTYKIADKLKRDLVFEGKEDVILADTPVKLMQKLHQIYSGTVILESGKAIILDKTKAEFIREKFAGKRIAVFYKFQAELECLLSVFQEDMTTDLGKFHAGECNNFAIQIVTGREGISLKEADFLVYFNIDFSATSYWQSRDRLTTMDRLENNVYWIFAEGGIEEKIYKVVQGKKNFTLQHFKKVFLSL